MKKNLLFTIGIFICLSVVNAQTPQIYQDFLPWTGNLSPDGIWRIAGVWNGTGGQLDPANVAFTQTYPGETSQGFVYLTQTDNAPAGSESGAEIQSLTTYGYGYYEVRMKVTDVAGVCAAFFTKEGTNVSGKLTYGELEFDHEFLTNESWLSSSNIGKDHFSTHPNMDVNYIHNSSFNPSLAFHRYGFLWQPGRLDYTVDKVIVHTTTNSGLNTTVKNFIMINNWSSGNVNWGGGPPQKNAITIYDWIKFYPNVTSIPTDQTTNVMDINQEQKVVLVSPNPFQTDCSIFISHEVILKDAILKMYDVCGREVKAIFISNYETTISKGELPSGLYFYALVNNNENISKGKLLIQ
ncbi:MAG: family 16 glycosylhydrolase [Bacteroidetes bacterium]|nr:family 16 glycosylhydrolase [Bacteroidota bacterium]